MMIYFDLIGIYRDFIDEKISWLFDEILCLYTHNSIAVSMLIEVNKNKDVDLFIVFFYLISGF